MAEKKDIDEITGTETTGHEWDGIKELNTPLPRWWTWVFIATIIWGVAYWVAMPAWPLISSYTTGVLGYSSRANVEADLEQLRSIRGEKAVELQNSSLADIRNNPDLLSFSVSMAKQAFGDNCAPCHGISANGSVSYPNLNDDDWLWGGDLDAIYQTISYGIRSEHDETRFGDMAAYGTDEILSADDINDVTAFVRTLSGQSPEGGNVANGQSLFVENCVSCHGENGAGLAEFGAPNLTDAIWLFGGDSATIADTITNGRKGVMPHWVGRLDEPTRKALAVYVHSLGGGQ